MSSPDPGFRCAAASLARAEALAGTATHVRTWLLLEHTGPWGEDALLHARLPEGLGAELKRRARQHRAKILLIRRYSSRPSTPDGVRVFAAYADPVAPRIESGVLADPREVLDLDLAGFRAGGTAGLPAYDGSLLCVCTNGRHDACCAELGRPVAAALAAARPEETWEVSHMGGDRFAANLVVLPHGLYYGRLDAGAALAVAQAHAAGRVDLAHLRGRSSWPMPAQAAEIAVRHAVGLTGIDEVRLTALRRDGALTLARLQAGGTGYEVVVRTTRSTSARLTCKALRENPVAAHEVVDVREVAG